MQPPVLLAPLLLLVGIGLLAATELAVLYRPDIQTTGTIFGIFFTIVGIRLQFTNEMFSALPSGLNIIGALTLQVILGIGIFFIVYFTMQRTKPYFIERFNPPFPNN